MTKKKQASGGARLVASGKKPVLLGFTPEQKAAIKAAAELEGRTMTQFITWHIVRLAEKNLEKARQST